MAAALVGVLLPSLARAENDYEHAKALVELRWLDVAERFLKKPGLDKNEAALGAACLLKGQAEASRDPLKQEELYDKALAKIDEYRKAAPKEDRLQGEALSLEGGIRQSLAQVYEVIIRDPRTPADKRKSLVEQRNKIRADAVGLLLAAMTQAEQGYIKALADYRNPINNGPQWETAKLKAFEAFFISTQKCFLHGFFRNAEQQDPGSAEQKALGQKMVQVATDWLKKQNEREAIGTENIYVQMFMDYTMGRGWAFAGDPEKAGKEFDKVIDIDVTNFDAGEARFHVTALRTRCIYYKARAWADKALISKAEADWHKALQSNWHEVLAGNPGTDPGLLIKSRILKGQCQGKVGQFSTAINDLNRALQDIDKAEQDRTFSHAVCESLRFETYQVMAEIITEMRRLKIPVQVAPEALVQAGLVSYRQERYDEAIGCFRDAINRARMADIAGDWAKRLVIGGEPMAWYLMGNAYHRSEREIEAQLAYEGALLSFWGEDGKAIPEKFRKDNAALVEQLKARILTPCANNGRIAASAERRANPSKFNSERLDRWLDWQVWLDPSSDVDFLRAMIRYENAVAVAEEARAMERSGRAPEGLQRRADALQGFAKAEEAFLLVPDASPSREEAIYWAGMCCYQSMGLLGGRRQNEDERKTVDELGERSLKHFGSFRAFVKEKPPRPKSSDAAAAEAERREIEARRARRLATLDLTEPFIQFERKKYTEALAAAEKLRDRQDLDAGQQEGLHQILFKCYKELGLQLDDIAEVQKHLEKAEKEAEWFKEASGKAQGEEQERLKRIYYNMASQLGQAYYLAYDKARKKGDEKKAKEMYERQGIWYDVVNQDPANQNIDGLGRTAKIFFDLGNYQKAKENYEKLLKFDTRGDRTRVPDEKLMSFEKLKDAVKGSDFPSVEMIRLAKKKLDSIKAAMMGGKVAIRDRDGETSEMDIPKDYDKALVLIGRFLDEYKNYDTVDGKAGDARKGLEAIKDELEFRLKMLRASNEITTCYVALGKQQLEEKRPDEAKKTFQEGLKNADNALKLWPRDAELIFNRAFCQLASGETGNVEEAVKTLADLRRGTRYGGELWWKATKAFTQGLIDLGRHDEARGIIVQIILSSDPEALKFNWPEFKDVAIALGEKIFPGVKGEDASKKLLGDKVKMPEFDYTPKSELEKNVARLLASMDKDVKDGKLAEAERKAKQDLLKELVAISKDNPAALKKLDESLDNLTTRIMTGRVKSLKSLGGESRGEEVDKLGPDLKPEQPAEEKPAQQDAPAKEGASRSGAVRPLASVRLCMEGRA